MSVKKELLALKNKDGVIVPEVALDWAQAHPKSELHKAINWDLERNARVGLLQQVRQLIVLHIRIEPRKPSVVSLSIDRAKRQGGGYRERADVLKAPRLRAVMLEDALHELELLERRFGDLVELAEVWQAVKAVARRVAVKPRKKGREDQPRVSA